MLRKWLGYVVLSVSVGFTAAVIVFQMWRAETPNAVAARSTLDLMTQGVLLICWTFLVLFLIPWVVVSFGVSRRTILAFIALTYRLQDILAWMVAERKHRAHAALMWDSRPALTDDEQATADARKRVLDLLRDSMLIVGESENYIPSDDVLDKAYHAGNIPHHWGSGTRAKALSHIRDYWFVEGKGGARQTIIKPENLRVLAREVEMGSVRLVQTSAPPDSTEGDGPDGP